MSKVIKSVMGVATPQHSPYLSLRWPNPAPMICTQDLEKRLQLKEQNRVSVKFLGKKWGFRG